jgi:hypothetical protein
MMKTFLSLVKQWCIGLLYLLAFALCIFCIGGITLFLTGTLIGHILLIIIAVVLIPLVFPRLLWGKSISDK